MKIATKVFSILLIFALIVGLNGGSIVSQAKAVNNVNNNEKIFEIANEFKANAVEVTAEETEEYVGKFKSDLHEQAITPHLDSSIKLDFDNLMISGFLNADQKEYVISVPFIGDIEKGSLFTAVYDEQGELVRTAEYQFKDLNQKYGQVKTWNDGKLSVNQKINKSEYEGQFSTMSWSCMNDCLASMGVANWVLAAVAVACAAACTTVVLCAPCIQGMGLFLYFELDYCLDKCFPI